MGLLNVLATGGTTAATVDWSTLITASSFDGILNGISTVLPVVIPVALSIMGIGIVWSFVKRFVLGA